MENTCPSSCPSQLPSKPVVPFPSCSHLSFSCISLVLTAATGTPRSSHQHTTELQSPLALFARCQLWSCFTSIRSKYAHSPRSLRQPQQDSVSWRWLRDAISTLAISSVPDGALTSHVHLSEQAQKLPTNTNLFIHQRVTGFLLN